VLGHVERAEEGQLLRRRLLATQDTGGEKATTQELAFFRALDMTEHYQINEGKLELSTADDNTVAVLRPK